MIFRKHTIFCLCLLPLLFTVSCAGTGRHGNGNGSGTDDQKARNEQADYSCAYFFFMWGNAAELESRWEEALEAYEKAIVCDPGAAYIMQKLARLLVTMDRKGEALEWVEKILADHPQDLENLFLKAGIFSSMGEFEQAVNCYNMILQKDSGNINAMLALSSLYIHQHDYDEARLVLEKLVRLHPDSFEGFHFLAKLYQEARLFDKALVAYEKALDVNWSNPLAFEAADLYERENRLAEAVRLYELILAEEESNEVARIRLANLLLMQEKTDQAFAELKILRQYVADVIKYDLAVGRVFIEHKMYDEAVEYFQHALTEKPAFEEARYLIALTYFEKGDLVSAETQLRQITVTSPVFEEAILLLSRILQKDDPAAAVSELEKMIAGNDTRRISFYVVLATLYRDANRLDEAEKIFHQALQNYPAAPDLLFEYGLFLDRLGRSEEALSQMEKVIELNPQDAYALNYVGYTWADNGVNLDKSLEYILRATALKPEDGYIRDSLGWVYYRMGQVSKAIAELEKARGIVPDDPAINEHLGDVYLKSGRVKEAYEIYEAAIRLQTDEAKKAKIREKLQQAIEKYGP